MPHCTARPLCCLKPLFAIPAETKGLDRSQWDRHADICPSIMSSNTSSALSRRESWRLLILVGVCLGIIFNTFQGEGAPLVASIAFSGIAFATTFSLIRWLGPVFMNAGLKGKDMAKPRRPEMYVADLFLGCRNRRAPSR